MWENLKKIFKVFFILSIFLIFIFLSLKIMPIAPSNFYKGGTSCFSGYVFRGVFVKPFGKISCEEAKNKTSYCLIHFYNDGKVAWFKKYVNGKLVLVVRYFYKFSSIYITKSEKSKDGKKRLQFYDYMGNFYREDVLK